MHDASRDAVMLLFFSCVGASDPSVVHICNFARCRYVPLTSDLAFFFPWSISEKILNRFRKELAKASLRKATFESGLQLLPLQIDPPTASCRKYEHFSFLPFDAFSAPFSVNDQVEPVITIS